MSKKRRGRKHRAGGRVTPKGTRPSASRPMFFDDGPDAGVSSPIDEHPLAHIAHALRADHPIDLLATGSSMAYVAQPRRTSPFETEEPGVSIDELLEILFAHDDPATTALLGAFALVLDDELTRRRCAKAIAGRRWDTPDWFAVLDQAKVDRVVEMTDVLRDGDNIYLELSWPTGHVMTFVVFIDHNLGSLAKDAFTMPMTVDDMRTAMRDHVPEPDVTFADVDPADARARLEDAVEIYDRTWPTVETDSWPTSQPLLRWALSLLPEGGQRPEPREWDEDELETISLLFMASPYAAALDVGDVALVDHILWYGTGYGHGDPYRWGPPRAEIFLADWVPRKIVAPSESLQRMPAVLRAFVWWAHDQIDVPDRRTRETLAAIDEWEPEFLAAIADDGRRQGAEALLEAMGLFDDDLDDGWEDDLWDDEEDWWQASTERLQAFGRRAVGGEEAFLALDDRPLPDEPLELTDVPDDIVDRVRRVASLTDTVCDDHFGDPELRTACRRLLADVAAADPAIFRRRSKDETAAAAVCWVVTKANGRLPHGETSPMLAAFGVSGSVTQRAAPMLRALGVADDHYWASSPSLGTTRYLISGYRAKVMGWRDRVRPA